MNIPDLYGYLVRARRDLWNTLEGLPDEVLARPLPGGGRFRCLKDLVFHIAVVEDGWVNVDIRGEPPALDGVPALGELAGYADVPLAALLDYWRAVEERTLTYLPMLTSDELGRIVTVEDLEGRRFVVRDLLWHVMLHEVRHTAQIAVLLRMQGFKPPALDLLWYLPRS